MPDFTTSEYLLFTGIVWLSGLFVWLIKKFMASYEKNTVTLVRLHDTLEGVDRKLDTAADRDVEIVKTLAAIHAKWLKNNSVCVINRSPYDNQGVIMKGYKTIAFNLLMAVIAVLSALNPEAELPSSEDVQSGVDAVSAAVAAVWGLGNILLRAITDTPIFKKETPDA
jgi:hypothetical protein